MGAQFTHLGGFVVLLMAALFAFPPAGPASAEFYKCVDERGTKYWADYGNDPAPKDDQDQAALPKCKEGAAGRFLPLLPDNKKYTDRNGITFWVDDESKIPPEYRGQDQKSAPKAPVAAEPEPAPQRSTAWMARVASSTATA